MRPSRRRGGLGAATTGLAAPVLTVADLTLSWTWTNLDPEVWSIEAAAAPEGPFVEFTQELGVERSYGEVTPGEFFRIRGLVDGEPFTGYSNVVEGV
jgi:hypothetical protein